MKNILKLTLQLAVAAGLAGCASSSDDAYFRKTETEANVYLSPAAKKANKVAVLPFKAPTELIGVSVADLWVTGYTDSQGRVRCSDVWLWDAPARQYSFNAPLSAIPNLEISIADQRIEGGIANCGCAAQCFYEDSYAWQASKLITIVRRAQDCERYREYRLNEKNDLILVKDEIIDSGNPGQQAIENTKAYDWQRHARIMRKSWE